MTHISTCLWLADGAEDAAAFYTSLLPGDAIHETHRPAPEAPPILLHFTIGGAPFSILNAGGGPAATEAASKVGD